jgi:WD40 repeat protein
MTLTRAQGLGSLALCLAGNSDPLATVLNVTCAYGHNRLTPLVAAGNPARPTLVNLVRIYGVDEGKYVFALEGKFPPGAESLTLAEDGQWLAAYSSGGQSTQLRVFHVATGREVKLADPPTDGSPEFDQLAFSPNGRWFAQAATNLINGKQPAGPRHLRVWELPSGRRVGGYTFPADQNEGGVSRLRFTPGSDGLVGSIVVPVRHPEQFRERLVVWRVGTDGTLGHKLELETGDGLNYSLSGGVFPIVFTHDGRMVACATSSPQGHAVCVWDLGSGSLRHTVGRLHLRHTPIYCEDFAFSPDSRRLFADGKVWDMSTGLELMQLTPELLGGRPRKGTPPEYAYDGTVVRCLFASDDGIDVYAFDGTPRP